MKDQKSNKIMGLEKYLKPQNTSQISGDGVTMMEIYNVT